MLAQMLGEPAGSVRPVAGGDHRAAFRVECARGTVFLKCGAATEERNFAAEATGLTALSTTGAVRTAQVLTTGCVADTAFLALQWIDLRAGSAACEARLGEGLATLHHSSAASFGWDQDNTIGASAQYNDWCPDWIEFFAERRLAVQLDLARARGAEARLLDRGQQLRESLAGFFAGYRPVPALLHGDLWGGNWAADVHDMPVIFDPAVYYGDREADLAMTRLFGGFGPSFHAAYAHAWPLDAGAAARVPLYNLYHVLNHFNLFGGCYARQALRMIDELLAQLRG